MQVDNSTSRFELLLAHADEGTPTLEEGLPNDSTGDAEAKQDPDVPLNFWDDGGDQNSLPEQRWGVLAPEGKRGDEMLAAIAPLMALRAQEQEAEVKVYRLPSQMTADEAARWRREVFDPVDQLKEELPRYQLLLGDLHELAAPVHEVMGLDGYVGRLAFDAIEDYAAYAQKVVDSENLKKAEAARALFYTVHDGTAATRVGHRSMVEPAVRLAQTALDKGQFPTNDLQMFGRMSDPVPEELFEQAGQTEPAVLMSVSHGAGSPRNGWKSAAAQLAAQGAMSFGREGTLRAEDFQNITFLPKGFWLMFACFGAGTPADSKFRHWLDLLRKARAFPGRPEAVLKSLPVAGSRPFVSAHTKVCLTNPNGPLAILGHLDLAWSYSFQDLDTGKGVKRPARFLRIINNILKGDRYGLSTRELYQASGEANKQLLETYDAEQKAQVEKKAFKVNPKQRGHLWMLRQDLAGYVLLGDPAARLPIVSVRERRRLAREARRAQQQAQAPVQIQTKPSPPQPAPQPEPAPVQTAAVAKAPGVETRDLEVMEEAVMGLIAGDTTPKAVAKELGVSVRTVKKWEDVFTDAGRRALAQLKDS